MVAGKLAELGAQVVPESKQTPAGLRTWLKSEIDKIQAKIDEAAKDIARRQGEIDELNQRIRQLDKRVERRGALSGFKVRDRSGRNSCAGTQFRLRKAS